MTAKVMRNGSVYYSPVFAVSFTRKGYKAVVLDSTFEKLIVVDICKRDQYTVLFMDFDTAAFSIDEQDFKSYWNDRDIFKTIGKKKYTPQMLEEAKVLVNNMAIRDFTAIKGPSDIKALQQNAFDLHDGYVLGVTEQNGALEILFDTSWGSLIILRCKDVVINTLKLGTMFWCCEMILDEAGFVTLSCEPMERGEVDAQVLKAGAVEFKPIFERRIKLKNFSHFFTNGSLFIKDKRNKAAVEISKTNEILNFADRGICGYLDYDDPLRLMFAQNDVFYSISEYIWKSEEKAKAAAIFRRFQEEGAQNGYHFDSFPLWSEEECPLPDYGALLYSQEYGKIHGVICGLQIISTVLLLWNACWLLVQLSNPGMRWFIFLIFGPGISLMLLLLCLLMFVVRSIQDKKIGERCFLELYENMLIYRGYDSSISCAYEDIKKVEYKHKRITVVSNYLKVKLHKTKNDPEIFELIHRQMKCKD